MHLNEYRAAITLKSTVLKPGHYKQDVGKCSYENETVLGEINTDIISEPHRK